VAEYQPGDKVARKYTLTAHAGRGGMGDVWVAHDAAGSEVAIKTLRPDRRLIEQAEDRFRQEARVSAKLHHPNIPRVIELVEEDDGTLLLVMERLRGETLKELLKHGPIDIDRALDIGLPILDALGAAHAHGIIHRDVTPANILLAEENGSITPKLIDFGVAKADDNIVLTKKGHALGTPHYMSPEQIRSGDVDGRSDLFGFSITLFEAITGTNPFKRKAVSGSLAAVLESEVEQDPRIPPALWEVLARGFSKNADERFATSMEMAAALRAAAGRPARTNRRWPLVVAACVLAGVVVAAALIIAR
jgi:serine/threonine-protein kinase